MNRLKLQAVCIGWLVVLLLVVSSAHGQRFAGSSSQAGAGAFTETQQPDGSTTIYLENSESGNIVTVSERKTPRWYLGDHYSNFIPADTEYGIGISVQELVGELGDYFGVPNGEGVLVTEVYANSAAEDADLKVGDVITAIDSIAVDRPEDVLELLREQAETGSSTLEIVRDHRTLQVVVQLDQNDFRRYGRLRFRDGERTLLFDGGVPMILHDVAPHLPEFLFYDEGKFEDLRDNIRLMEERLERLHERLE
jgi:hypothetical protein